MATSCGGASTSDGSASRPAKLLCSLGGRILPWPSDGTLRYIGGDTRIISLPRNSPLSFLHSKLTNAYSLSSPFLLMYQLPDTGLDSLISVSTEEDFEKMMEEYDKLTGAWTKLRVFLFPLSDLNPSSEAIDQADSDFQSQARLPLHRRMLRLLLDRIRRWNTLHLLHACTGITGVFLFILFIKHHQLSIVNWRF